MDELEQVQLLAGELGGAIGLEDLAFDEDDKISLLIDDARLFHLVVDRARDGLALMTRIADAERVSPALLARAMRAHFGWQAGDGAQFALEPETGGLVLQRLLPLPGLDYARLRAALDSFIATADAWAGAAADAAAEAPASEDAPAAGAASLADRLAYKV